MRPPLNREDINDTAKLIMHRLIARSLARDPSFRIGMNCCTFLLNKFGCFSRAGIQK